MKLVSLTNLSYSEIIKRYLNRLITMIGFCVLPITLSLILNKVWLIYLIAIIITTAFFLVRIKLSPNATIKSKNIDVDVWTIHQTNVEIGKRDLRASIEAYFIKTESHYFPVLNKLQKGQKSFIELHDRNEGEYLKQLEDLVNDRIFIKEYYPQRWSDKLLIVFNFCVSLMDIAYHTPMVYEFFYKKSRLTLFFKIVHLNETLKFIKTTSDIKMLNKDNEDFKNNIFKD